MKFIFGTLLILLGLMIPASAFAWSENQDGTDADRDSLFVLTYEECSRDYHRSGYTAKSIDCICLAQANHAVKYSAEVYNDNLPPLPDEVENRCLDHYSAR